MRIDEHQLAGYMAGDLTASDRQSVTTALLQDRDLREWLHMATEAMSAAGRSADDNPLLRAMPAMEASRPGIRREDRRAMPSRSRVRRTGS